ncbi:hypothetical protein TNCT6_60120 [Streptomyces sp. 6-11-2]|nr:hypothetical protein TNCT6_60120 [Streptomyces sp. 6-11-2]
MRHRQVVGGDRQADPEDPVVDGLAECLVALPQTGEDDHDEEGAERIGEPAEEGAATARLAGRGIRLSLTGRGRSG